MHVEFDAQIGAASPELGAHRVEQLVGRHWLQVGVDPETDRAVGDDLEPPRQVQTALDRRVKPARRLAAHL